MLPHLLIKAATYLTVLTLFNSLKIITAEPDSRPIFDIDGDQLNSGFQYYVAPVKWGEGGGLNYVKIQDYYSRCPGFAVTQSFDNPCGTVKLASSDYGLPLIFKPKKIEEQNITDVSQVIISFAPGNEPLVPYRCDKPTMNWKMNNHGNQKSADLGMFHFGGLGVDHEHDDDQSSLFKITKNEAYGYRLTYCPPSTSGLNESTCGSLKVVYDRYYGIRRLVLAADDNPFMVMFVKAHGRSRSPY